MSYKVQQTEEGFDILERKTDVTINLKTNESRARDLCRKLNLGSGFNGFTPDFFANLRGLETK